MSSMISMSRSVILALVLTLASVLYYGYQSYGEGDYLLYSMPTVKALHQENFIRDAYVQSMSDMHPTFSKALQVLFSHGLEIAGPFILFLLSKFLLFLGIILLARRLIAGKVLYIFFIIFLFPFINFGLANSTLTTHFPFVVPRMMSWGFFLLGFNYFLSKKYFTASLFWGFASLFHLQFLFLTLPMLFVGVIFFHPAFSAKKKLIHLFFSGFILCAIALAEIISVYRNSPFEGGISNKDFFDFYVNHMFFSNMDPANFLFYRLGLFLLLILPLFFWKRLPGDYETKKIWMSAIWVIIIGTVIYCISVKYFFIKSILLMWYPGFTPFVTLTSVIFLISIITKNWKSIFFEKAFSHMLEIIFVYAYILFPYIAPVNMAVDMVRNKKILKIRTIFGYAVLLIIIFIFARFSMTLKYKYYIYYIPAWSGIDFSVPELPNFIRLNTPKDSLFLVPPNTWFMQPVAYRSTVVDSYHPGLGGYLLEWKRKMDDVVGADIFTISLDSRNELYKKRPVQDMLGLAKKYNADYFVTMNENVVRESLARERSFRLVYWDDDYVIYKVEH